MSTLLERLEAIDKLGLSVGMAHAARRDTILTLTKTNALLARGVESSILQQITPLLDANRKLESDKNACSGTAFEALSAGADELAELTRIEGSWFEQPGRLPHLEFTNLGEVLDTRFAWKDFWKRAQYLSLFALPISAMAIGTVWQHGMTVDTWHFLITLCTAFCIVLLIFELDILVGSKVWSSVRVRVTVANRVEADAQKLDRYLKEALVGNAQIT